MSDRIKFVTDGGVDDPIIRTLRSWLKPCFTSPTCPYCDEEVFVSLTNTGAYVCDNGHWSHSRYELKNAHWYNRTTVVLIAVMLIVVTSIVVMGVERAYSAITGNGGR